MDDTTLGTVVLGLDRFALLDARLVEGEVWLQVQTTTTRTGCPDCGVVAVAHDRRTVQARDMPAMGRPVRLVWVKRIWRCEEPACPRRTWTEERPDVLRARHVMTQRARAHACREVADGRTVADLAREYGVGWATIMAAVVDHGLPLIDDPARLAGVTALGVDETTFLSAGPGRRTSYVTGLVDLGRGRLLDVVDGRAGTAVTAWLSARDEGWLSAVRRVALDPHRGYYNALVGGLEAPEVVLDAFHVVGLANKVVDEVRRRVQHQELGHRGRKGDPLYGIRRLLLTGAERLTDRGRQRLADGLADGDPGCEVWYAHMVKEQVRGFYRADSHDDAQDRLVALYQDCAESEIPEIMRLGRTLRRWHGPVMAYWRTDGLSNAGSESTNALIKKVKRIGHGFRNPHNYRLRLLLHCGGIQWHDHPTASIRGRSPRLIA